MDHPSPADIEALKPRKGALVLLIPIFLIFLVLGLYVITFVVAVQGRSADGERSTLAWKGCTEAQGVVAKRVEAMGLGDPVFADTADGFELTVTLPSDVETARSIPGTLSERGQLVAKMGDRVVFDSSNVLSASIRQDLTLIPWTVLDIDPTALKSLEQAVMSERRGEVVYELDGVPIGRVSNLKGYGPEVEFTSEDANTDMERMRKVAARSIVLGSGPLPCALVLK